MKKKPNILFLFTDDQRYNTIHALGCPEIITPNYDRLVAEGTAFTQAHIPSGTCGAICMPSRAMLHTGRSLFHLEGEGQNIPRVHTTMGEAFGCAGYRTFGAGKWHNGTASFNRSFAQGDTIFFGGMWDHWNVPCCTYDPTGHYDNLIPVVPDFFQSNQVMRVHCDYFTQGRHSTEAVSDSIIRFLDQTGEAPFFAYAAYLAPHDPRTMPDKFRDMHPPDAVTLPPNYMQKHPFLFGVEEIRDELLAPTPRTEVDMRRHLAEYYGMISHLDDQIGKVLEELDQRGLAENTLVVLAGDNGLAVGSHGLMGKQNHYEHSIRVPLILRGPCVPKGKRISEPVYLFDVFPTLCELAGVDIPDTVDGQSLVPMLWDDSAKGRPHLYFAYADLIRSVKDNRFKLIEYVGETRRTQLFDLLQDPNELRDCSEDPQMEPVIRTLRARMVQFRDEWEEMEHPLGQRFWAACETEGWSSVSEAIAYDSQ